MNTQTKFETGATSEEINNLILYTDTTRELAQHRDRIYTSWVNGNQVPSSLHFNDLLKTACTWYNKEFRHTTHVGYKDLTNEQRLEYMDIYAQDYENWKKEHNL